jgi:hypothetical protein
MLLNAEHQYPMKQQPVRISIVMIVTIANYWQPMQQYPIKSAQHRADTEPIQNPYSLRNYDEFGSFRTNVTGIT